MTLASDAGDANAEAPCGLLRTTESGTILRANLTFCRWVGYSPEELIGQRRLQDLLTVGSRIFHHTHWAPLLRMQGSLSEIKFEVRHRDGTTLPMVLNAVRRDDAGVFVHEVAAYVARDRDRYEQELLRSRRRLEELVAEANQLHAAARDRAELAEQMIGIVSHDLRNPLNAIQMGAELLSGSDLSSHDRRLVDRIQRSVSRASHLITDLLDFTQARLGRGIAIALAEVALHDVVADTLDELRLSHPDRPLEHVRSGVGSCVADASRLAQLIGNLVSNAVAYGDADAPIIVRSTIAERCVVAVSNTGPSIPVDLQATLFEPMIRGGNGVASKARSVGLGLYIVREIARGHHGLVTVCCDDERRTTFEIGWPARPPSVGHASAPGG
jgi:phosphoserine phosphatase RsbU/P